MLLPQPEVDGWLIEAAKEEQPRLYRDIAELEPDSQTIEACANRIGLLGSVIPLSDAEVRAVLTLMRSGRSASAVGDDVEGLRPPPNGMMGFSAEELEAFRRTHYAYAELLRRGSPADVALDPAERIVVALQRYLESLPSGGETEALVSQVSRETARRPSIAMLQQTAVRALHSRGVQPAGPEALRVVLVVLIRRLEEFNPQAAWRALCLLARALPEPDGKPDPLAGCRESIEDWRGRVRECQAWRDSIDSLRELREGAQAGRSALRDRLGILVTALEGTLTESNIRRLREVDVERAPSEVRAELVVFHGLRREAAGVYYRPAPGSLLGAQERLLWSTHDALTSEAAPRQCRTCGKPLWDAGPTTKDCDDCDRGDAAQRQRVSRAQRGRSGASPAPRDSVRIVRRVEIAGRQASLEEEVRPPADTGLLGQILELPDEDRPPEERIHRYREGET